MGMVLKSYSVFRNMTALDNVGFGLRMRKHRSGERNRRPGELLETVGRPEHARKYPPQPPGGQQQRGAPAPPPAIGPRGGRPGTRRPARAANVWLRRPGP